jgi:hypothetical protein
MSTELVVIGEQGQQAIQAGGLGLGSRLFKLQPATIEVVQKMTRQEGAIPGKLRVTATNEHYDEMQVVMMFEPVEQRAYFEGDDFASASKLCFSLDNLRPHAKAQIPQAMACGYYNEKGYYVSQCTKADWATYRVTKAKADLPKCRNYWHLVLADRVTQLPYYLNVKGASIAGFTKAMQSVARLIALMQASGKKPNIFDVSFKLYVTQEKGAPNYILGFKEFAPLKEEDRDAFGAIFLDFAARKAQGGVAEQEEAVAETAEVEASATEAPAGTIPAAVLQGTALPKQEVITI